MTYELCYVFRLCSKTILILTTIKVYTYITYQNKMAMGSLNL